MRNWHTQQLLFVLGCCVLFVLAASIPISNFKDVQKVYQLSVLQVGFPSPLHLFSTPISYPSTNSELTVRVTLDDSCLVLSMRTLFLGKC